MIKRLFLLIYFSAYTFFSQAALFINKLPIVYHPGYIISFYNQNGFKIKSFSYNGIVPVTKKDRQVYSKYLDLSELLD